MSRRAVIALAVLATIVAAIVIAIVMRQQAEAPGSRQNTGSQSQAEAIEQAKAYRSDQTCTDALTPATHTATGARYTFPSGCLAPGWVAD